MNRRSFLGTSASSLGGITFGHRAAAETEKDKRPKVAAIITEYRGFSHADVIVGRFIQGYTLGLEPFWPRTKLISMYVDQFPKSDLSRNLAHTYNIEIRPSVEEALMLDNTIHWP